MAGSLAEVARRAGVSIATASRALSGSSHPVSSEVRERIERAARELGYSPSALARALVTRRSRIIGVIVGDIVDPYFAEITRGVEDVARRSGYLTIVCDADRDPSAELAYLRLLGDYQAEGVIFSGGGALDDLQATALQDQVRRAMEAGVRVVSLAPRLIGGATITVDNRAAAADITRHLLALGHQSIAFVAGMPAITTSVLRLEGYRAAMTGAGREPEEPYAGNFRFESGQAAADEMVRRGLPHAVLAANDESAIGVVMALRDAGVAVPGDVSVAGIGNTRTSRFVDLTTVSVELYELGSIAARRMIEPDGWDPAFRVTVPHRVIVRGTTRERR